MDSIDLEDVLGHLIHRAEQRAMDLYSEEVGEKGLRLRQFALLTVVVQNPGLNQTDLVRLSSIDRSTVTEMVGRLMKRGFLERRRTSSDRRCNSLWITEAGKQAVKESIDGMMRSQDRMLAPLPEHLRPVFVECLQLLTADEEQAARVSKKASGIEYVSPGTASAWDSRGGAEPKTTALTNS